VSATKGANDRSAGGNEMGDLTAQLQAWQRGDRVAAEALFEQLHQKLRAIAKRAVHELGGRAALETTEVVAELYLSLERHDRNSWESRQHFFAVVAKIARSVLVDCERQRRSLKRGGACLTVSLEELSVPVAATARPDLLAVDAALCRLEEIDTEAGQVVELKFFAGLDLEEIAASLGISRSSVVRRWRYARAWLLQELTG
jgi:RNA polymerase sigma factor (TIGR02999 family)